MEGKIPHFKLQLINPKLKIKNMNPEFFKFSKNLKVI